MKKRALSLLLVLVMVFSMLPSPVYAETVGNGTAENPYQIGDIVTNDGSAEPEGATVENSYWKKTSEVSASENLVCQAEEHDHVTAYCEVAYETAECALEDHPAEGETKFTHEDGTVCAYDAEQAKWLTTVAAGYTCGKEAHTHTEEAGCMAAYTVWTLTQEEQTLPPADNALSTLEVEPLAEDDERGLPIHFFLASPGNITNIDGNYANYYIPNDETSAQSYTVADIKNDSRWNSEIKTENGIRNVSDESIITNYIASWPGGNQEAFEKFGTVSIPGAGTFKDTEYEIKWVSIMFRDNKSKDDGGSGLNCSQYFTVKYDHIHVDGLLVKKIEPGEMEVYKAIPAAVATETTFQFTLQKMLQPNLTSPPTSAGAVDTSFAAMTLIASIPAGETEAQITDGSDISFGYYKLTEVDNREWQNAGIKLTDSNGRIQTVDTDTLYICIAPNGDVLYSTSPSGPYTVMEHVAVQNERKPVTVHYQWRIYDQSGSFVEDRLGQLGTHGVPADASVTPGTAYTYNTGYVEGTSYHDYEHGLLYTFQGWDTYSHSSAFAVDPSLSGYTKLDDGDTNAANNKKITITADTWINGYWTVSNLPAADAYLLVHKDVVVADGGDAAYVNDYLRNTGKMFIRIDPGIDKDDDGKSQIDVDYPGAVAEGGYRINVYQYVAPFKFTELQAEVPGYTRTVDIMVTENSNLTLTEKNGDNATVSISAEYEPSNTAYNLGAVTYTNTYTKNVGDSVTEYPTLNIVKRATDTGLLQANAVFTLYSDEDCSDESEIASFTTNEDGVAAIEFASLLADATTEKTFYLKETAAPAGYLVDGAVYKLTLTSATKDELRGNEFVEVTTYALNVTVPTGSSAEPVQNAADAQNYSLNVYNRPILGQVTVNKVATGLENDSEAKARLAATVTIHGPITRNAEGDITGLGREYTLVLNKENEWTFTQAYLPIGEYLIHENMASVHGYTWEMNKVDYGTPETVDYNNITSGVFYVTADSTEVDVTITNSYVPWASADFYIHKINPSGGNLGGATFELYTNESCNPESKVTDPSITISPATGTTGTNGIVWFSGFKVPAEDEDRIVTYYLKETKAPAGYYLSDTVYKVEIKAVSNNGTITYEPKISVKVNGNWVPSPDFSKDDDGLTIVNTPVKGQITLEKEMINAPEDLTSVTFYVSGPNGYAKTVPLTKDQLTSDGKKWTTTLHDLALGTYTIIEQNADAPGYDLVTTYEVGETKTTDKATVVLRETSPGQTERNTVFEGSVAITNTYTRRVETIENPASLMVKKIGENGEALAGAVFTLVRERDGETVSYTTNAEGKVTFSFLSGTINNGQVMEGKYTLTETKAPDGYAATDTEWTITVKEDGDGAIIRLNENTNIWENIWDWIIGNVRDEENSYVIQDNVLTVGNVELADMTISKTFVDASNNPITPPEGAVIEVAVFDSNNKLVKQVELSASTSIPWTATITDIPAGTYTVRETSPSLHGYTWNSASFVVTGVDASDVTSAASSVEVVVENSEDVHVEITNTYTAWQSVDFYVMKTKADGTTPLAGATFTLYDEEGNPVTDRLCTSTVHTNSGHTTGLSGILHFHEFTVPADDADNKVIYYLVETAPANYYSNGNVYKIVVSHDDKGYDLTITTNKDPGEELTIADHKAHFNHANDVLTVVNEEITADLVITKTFSEQSKLKLNSVKVDIEGENGYKNTVTLGTHNGYTVTLEGLSLGKYTIKEQYASRDGYALTVKYTYNETVVTDGPERQNGVTVQLTDANDNAAATVEIENTYLEDRNDPAYFTVKKVDAADTTKLLEGAVFGLYDSDDKLVEEKTTNTDGEVRFGPFDSAAEYTLKEISAPQNYHEIDDTWKVTVREKDGKVEVKLDTDKNLYENFFEWIVEIVTGQTSATWQDGVLTVKNVKKTGNLTITKAVVDPENRNANKEYSFTLDASDNTFDQTFTLTAGGDPMVIKDIPWGTTYTLTEDTSDAAFTSSIDSPTGTIGADNTTVNVVNTYKYEENNPGLNLLKVDADTSEPIEGVTFQVFYDEACTNYMNGGTTGADGKVNIPFHYYDYDTYYLKEEAPAEGYFPNETVYVVEAKTEYKVRNAGTTNVYTEKRQILTVKELGNPAVDDTNEIKYTYTVKNTAIKPVEISVTKTWNDGGYHDRPEEVTATIYRDRVEYGNVKLNEDNGWSYTWSGPEYTDEYEWSVDEKTADVPTGYTPSVTNEGNDWTITNTRAPKSVEITVTKAWKHNGGKNLPESVSVTLYKDGIAYKTVELSEENDWTYTWDELTDVSVWSVDETEVPTGYTKEVTVDGCEFVITNTRTINPVKVSVTKAWVASEGVKHPESVEAVLYRDGKAYKTVKLSKDNNWTYTWDDLTDEYTWAVDEKEVPDGYTKNVTNNGYDFTITNTKDFKKIDVSVKKIWYDGDDVTHPSSVKVTLYRDDVAYDTVTLSASNNWTYTWKDLTDEFEWEVDEPSVPSGYNKTVRVHDEYTYYITNTYEDIPATGDFTDFLGLGMLGMVGVVGFCFTTFMLFVPRKKGKYQK